MGREIAIGEAESRRAAERGVGVSQGIAVRGAIGEGSQTELRLGQVQILVALNESNEHT